MAQLIEPAKDPWLGRKLAGGKFELVSLLATGGMGKVYLGRHTTLGREVAIKALHGSYQTDERMVTRFWREAQAASRIRHPNVVEVIDFGQEPDGLLYIVMEHLSGEELEAVIERDAPLSPKRAVDLAAQVCAATGAAHASGIIHRDLKPKNIVVQVVEADDGKLTELVKVLDFGIAKIQDNNQHTIEMAAGTPEFMSPEQCRGETVDGRADIYSIGCILYYLLTGQVPFSGPNPVSVIFRQVSEAPVPPSRLVTGVPPLLDSLVLKTLQKSPAERYQDPRQLRADLLALAPSLSDETPELLQVARPSDIPVALEDSIDDRTPRETPSAGARGVEVSPELMPQKRTSSRPPQVLKRALEPFRGRNKTLPLIALGVGVAIVAGVGAWAGSRSAPREEIASAGAEAPDRPVEESTDDEVLNRPPRIEVAPTVQPLPRDVAEEIDAEEEAPREADAEAEADVRAAARSTKSRTSSGRRRGEREERTEARQEQVQAAATQAVEPPQPAPQEPAPAAGSQQAQSAPVVRTTVQVTRGSTADPTPARPAVPTRVAARINGFETDGSLPTSVVAQAVQRVAERFAPCYLQSAQRAGRGGADRVSVRFEIDETGRARRVSARGATLPGLNDCIGSAMQRVVSQRRPDLGTVQASFNISFQP